MRPGRGGALSAAALPELRGAPGRCGRPDRAGNGVSERRQSLDATAPVRGVAPPAVFCRGSRRLHRSGRVPGSRLSARSAWRRRMMGIRGGGLPRFRTRSKMAATPVTEWPRPRPRQGRPVRPKTDGTRKKLVDQLMAGPPAACRDPDCSGGCRDGGPGIEVGAGLPHRVQDHRQLARQRHGGALEADLGLQGQSPAAQRALALYPRED